jgi:hypothetical protein
MAARRARRDGPLRSLGRVSVVPIVTSPWLSSERTSPDDDDEETARSGPGTPPPHHYDIAPTDASVAATTTGQTQAAAASLREVRASIELLASSCRTRAIQAQAQRVNIELDDAITAALSQLRMYELPAGKALPSGVDDAVVVPD